MHAKGITPILNVSDLQASFAWFEKLGWTRGWDWGSPPTDEPWGVREMHVRHPDGHVFRISRGMGEST